MDMILIIGLIATGLCTASFLPQAFQTVRTHETKGISLSSYSILVTVSLLWLIYGILRSDIPLIISNFINLLATSAILFVKLREGTK